MKNNSIDNLLATLGQAGRDRRRQDELGAMIDGLAEAAGGQCRRKAMWWWGGGFAAASVALVLLVASPKGDGPVQVAAVQPVLKPLVDILPPTTAAPAPQAFPTAAKAAPKPAYEATPAAQPAEEEVMPQPAPVEAEPLIPPAEEILRPEAPDALIAQAEETTEPENTGELAQLENTEELPQQDLTDEAASQSRRSIFGIARHGGSRMRGTVLSFRIL